jgi:hypothetical protein
MLPRVVSNSWAQVILWPHPCEQLELQEHTLDHFFPMTILDLAHHFQLQV